MAENEILKILQQRDFDTGGHNGYTVIQLSTLVDKNCDEIAVHLNALYKQKKIKVSPTVHGIIARVI